MDEDLRERIERAAETAALFNARKHDGDANVQAIVGPLLGENPSFREYADEIPDIIAPVVARVNELSAAEQRDRLEELAPDRVSDLTTEDDDEFPLSALPNVTDYGEVRLRLAPNPNGPWHLGNARMAAVVGTYTERYDGWMLCRFDDTDPKTKRPDLTAYDAILDDLAYLGFEPDAVVWASDRLETYYQRARELIDTGGAYTCTCAADRFADLKRAGEACQHRDKDRSTTREEFDGMVTGAYDAQDMVLRVRTDIEHANPALRDWVAMRIVDTPHPRSEAAEYRCWPLLDFQSAVDDYEFDISHIVRGIDLQDSAKRQAFVYEYLDWTYPEVVHWGRVQVDEYEIELSTSEIRRLIELGELDGWDDPRAPTVASLRRRGIRGAAIVDAMVELGTSTSNVDLAMATVYAENRSRIDDDAARAFLVRDGIEKALVGGPSQASVPVHPDHPDRGTREIPVDGAVLVEQADVPHNGGRAWLKGLGCVRHTRDAFEFTGADIDAVRSGDVPVVHWVPADGSIPVCLRTVDGDVDGRAEPGLLDTSVDDVLQFERVGFGRIDHLPADPAGNDPVVSYYAHP